MGLGGTRIHDRWLMERYDPAHRKRGSVLRHALSPVCYEGLGSDLNRSPRMSGMTPPPPSPCRDVACHQHHGGVPTIFETVVAAVTLAMVFVIQHSQVGHQHLSLRQAALKDEATSDRPA